MKRKILAYFFESEYNDSQEVYGRRDLKDRKMGIRLIFGGISIVASMILTSYIVSHDEEVYDKIKIPFSLEMSPDLSEFYFSWEGGILMVITLSIFMLFEGISILLEKTEYKEVRRFLFLSFVIPFLFFYSGYISIFHHFSDFFPNTSENIAALFLFIVTTVSIFSALFGVYFLFEMLSIRFYEAVTDSNDRLTLIIAIFSMIISIITAFK